MNLLNIFVLFIIVCWFWKQTYNNSKKDNNRKKGEYIEKPRTKPKLSPQEMKDNSNKTSYYDGEDLAQLFHLIKAL